MGLFSAKPKAYVKYKDYLEDHGAELFAAWVDPEIFRLTGVAPVKAYRKKWKIRRDITLEEAVLCAQLAAVQALTVAGVTALFEQCVTAVSEDFWCAGRARVQSGDFAADERLQVPALTAMFEQARQDAPPCNNPLIKQPATAKEAVGMLTGLLELMCSHWSLLVQRLQVGAAREMRNLNQLAILDSIDIE